MCRGLISGCVDNVWSWLGNLGGDADRQLLGRKLTFGVVRYLAADLHRALADCENRSSVFASLHRQRFQSPVNLAT